MTATLTALIELAVEHGWGVAVLIIGAQIVLDRLLPVERIAAVLFGFRRSTHAPGAHRREHESRASAASRFAVNLTRDRNNGFGCTGIEADCSPF